MNKIENVRIGYDGKSRSVIEIENWYYSEVVKQDIPVKLDKLKLSFTDPSEITVIDFISLHFNELIVSSPKRLSEIIDIFNSEVSHLSCIKSKKFKKKDGLRDKLLITFGYKSNRGNLLIELASRLNIKSCPYCNMHYTLVIGQKSKRATFDFDHFFRKDIYPFLSMSFYNLIPSCKVCNQRKSTKQLTIDFNPYHASIHKSFIFKVSNPADLLLSKNISTENIKIVVIPTESTSSIEEYKKLFKLEEHYARHSDIAKEVFHKSKLLPYYTNPNNFSFLSNKSHTERLKLLLGTYIDPDDIEKRPLSKFIQDIWNQALGR